MGSQLNLFKPLENTFPKELHQNNCSLTGAKKNNNKKKKWAEAVMEFILLQNILGIQQNNLISLHK